MRTTPIRLAFSWFLSLAAAGCGSNTTKADPDPHDVEEISGTAIDTFDSGKSVTTAPVDPMKWTSINAVVDEGGTLKSYPGSIDTEGKLAIPGVPDGLYWLALSSPPPDDLPNTGDSQLWIANTSTSRTLDLGTLNSFRQGLIRITKPTTLVVDVPLLTPWKTYTKDGMGNVTQELTDSLAFVSRSADVSGNVYGRPDDEAQTGAPVNGATSLSWSLNTQALFIGYGDQRAPHLVSADDDFAILRKSESKVEAATQPPAPDAWASFTVETATEILRPSPFAMLDGGSHTLMGSFEPIPQKTFAFDYKGSSFNKFLDDLPSATLAVAYVNLSVFVAHGAPTPVVSGPVNMMDFTVSALVSYTDPVCNPISCVPAMCAAGCPDTKTVHLPGDYKHDFSYGGNPFGGSSEMAGVTFAFRVDVTKLLPGAMTLERLNGFYTAYGPVETISGKPLEPIISLPRNVKVNGTTAPTDQVTAGVGTTPEISFETPAIGKPTSYSVRITDVEDVTDANGKVNIWRIVATFRLPASSTSLKVPDGIIKPGKHYYFQILARINDTDPAAPFREGTTSSTAMTFTGLVTP